MKCSVSVTPMQAASILLAGYFLLWAPVPSALGEPTQTTHTNVDSDFVDKLKAAVIAARQYPKLEPAGQQGVPVVSFDYLNGVISNIKVDKSSGVRGLDLAARDAVRAAVFPTQPAELRNIPLHVVVSIPFILK